jgi:hypothetical protein
MVNIVTHFERMLVVLNVIRTSFWFMLMDFSDAAKHHENNKLFIKPRSDE